MVKYGTLQLWQFRAYIIAITGDIEKTYLYISVYEKDRDILRFLWFKDLFNEHPVQPIDIPEL